MGQRVELPLTFDKGLVESFDDSVVSEGFATELQNYIPLPGGGVRARRGWIVGQTTGDPATPQARGIGLFTRENIYETPALVQSDDVAASSGNAAITWPGATTVGNLLIAGIGFDGGTASTITPPAGWTLAIRTDNGTNNGVAIYYKQNAASETDHIWNVNDSFRVMAFEWSGMVATSALDKTSGASGNSSTAAPGSTGVLSQYSEVALVVADRDGTTSPAFSAWTQGFTERFDASHGAAPDGNAATATKVVAEIGALSPQATLNSGQWAAAIATFKAKTTGTPTTTTEYLVAHRGASAYDIYKVNADFSGSWSLLESVSAAGTTTPVAFARGMNVTIYTSTQWGTSRYYTGSSAAAITGSPAGRCAAFHKGYFFVAGTAGNPSRLWFSALGDYTTWPALNYIDVNEGDGEPIEDILSASDGMIIAKKSSLWLMLGSSEDNFSLHQLGKANGGYPGRCLTQTPQGVVVAGQTGVFLWSGGTPARISEPVETGYSLAGDYVSVENVGSGVYVCDEKDGTIWAHDLSRGIWWKETITTATEAPSTIFVYGQRMVYGPQNASTVALLQYRDLTTGARTRDGSLSETFKVHTPEMWVGELVRPFTPRTLYIQVRQRGGDSGDAGLVITPIYDGAAQTTQTISPKNGGSQTFLHRADVGYAQGVTKVQFRFEQTCGTSDDALLEPEKLVLVGYMAEPWKAG